MNKLLPYAQHKPICNKAVGWNEKVNELKRVPLHMRTIGWKNQMDEASAKAEICTCGLDDILKEVEK